MSLQIMSILNQLTPQRADNVLAYARDELAVQRYLGHSMKH